MIKICEILTIWSLKTGIASAGHINVCQVKEKKEREEERERERGNMLW